MEGKFCDGRTDAFCHQAQRRESMAWLCREFGISRKTGFKILDRRSRSYISRLNTRPVPSRVNASAPPSRASPHDSEPLWLWCIRTRFSAPAVYFNLKVTRVAISAEF